jgi:hypothetical protein
VLERATGAVVEVERDDGAAPAGQFVLDGSHLVFSKAQDGSLYDEHRLESLELRELKTGARRTLYRGAEGGGLSPIALSGTHLIWAQRAWSEPQRSQAMWSITTDDPQIPHAMESASPAAAVFLEGNLFMSTAQAIRRFRALDGTPEPVPSGILGRGNRSLAAGHRVLASTAQDAGRLELYDLDTGRTYAIEGEAQTLVALGDHIVWQGFAEAAGGRSFFLSRVDVPQ